MSLDLSRAAIDRVYSVLADHKIEPGDSVDVQIDGLTVNANVIRISDGGRVVFVDARQPREARQIVVAPDEMSRPG